MIDFTSWLTIANFVIMLAIAIGGIAVFRGAFKRAESDVQTRVREALSAENELLQARVMRVERENHRLDKLLQLLMVMLKKTQNIDLEIDDDVITLRTSSGTHVSRITGDLVP